MTAPIFLWLALLVGSPPAAAVEEGPPHLSAEELSRLDGAVARGLAFLVSVQAADGSFRPQVREDVPAVAATALVLWSLAGRDDHATQAAAAARWLLAQRGEDGSICAPGGRLCAYVSAVALRALEGIEPADAVDLDALQALGVFVGRTLVPESWTDLVEPAAVGRARAARDRVVRLVGDEDLAPRERAAVEFLTRRPPAHGLARPRRTLSPLWRPPGPEVTGFSYDDLLSLACERLGPEHQRVMRARDAIGRRYTIGRNPDLTQRYGPGGFPRGTEGLHYYYFVVSRVLAAQGDPVLVLHDGARRDWVRELSAEWIGRQRSDGRWVSEDATWWEDEPVVVTAFALVALRELRRVPATRGR